MPLLAVPPPEVSAIDVADLWLAAAAAAAAATAAAAAAAALAAAFAVTLFNPPPLPARPRYAPPTATEGAGPGVPSDAPKLAGGCAWTRCNGCVLCSVKCDWPPDAATAAG
ncbi:hypothetical protein EON68_04155, partial [archaeon]